MKLNTPNTDIEIGTVIDVNPASMSADVVLTRGRALQGVAFLGVYGSPYNQDLTWLTDLRGATVRVCRIAGEYFILHAVPVHQGEPDDEVDTVPITVAGYGGDDPNTYGNNVFADYSTNRNRAFLPGDKIIRVGPDTDITAWRGGILRFRAGPLAQFILSKFTGLARIVARRFQLYTDFGEVTTTHTPEGRVGLHIKGGADFAQETHPKEAHWTIQAWVGDKPGDPATRLFIRVNDKDDNEHVTLSYDIGGNAALSVSQNDTQDIGGSRAHTVGDSDDLSVGGNRSVGVEGNQVTDIDGNETKTVLGNQDTSVVGNETKNVAGNSVQSAMGMWDITAVGPVNITSAAMVKITAPMVMIN